GPDQGSPRRLPLRRSPRRAAFRRGLPQPRDRGERPGQLARPPPPRAAPGPARLVDVPIPEAAAETRPRPRLPLSRREHPLCRLALFLLTFVTTTLAGGLAFSEQGGFLGHGRFADGFAFSVPLMTILGLHELGHYFMCRRYGIDATLPYFIPSPFLIPP